MYEPRELEAIAKQAKSKLVEQNKQVDDLYADFREEPIAEETVAAPERPKIKRNPDRNFDYNGSEHVIASTPSNEDWEEEEREEIDPLDAPIFPGGPSPSDIQVWKKEYQDYTICVVQIVEDFFIFRTINRYEYKQIISLDLDQLQREEVICETCVLYPSKYTWKEMFVQKAGVPSTLASVIMEKSGFTKEYAIQVL